MFKGFTSRHRTIQSAKAEGGGAGSSNGASGLEHGQGFDDDGVEVTGNSHEGGPPQSASDADSDSRDDRPLTTFGWSGGSTDEEDQQPFDVEAQRLEAQRAHARRLAAYNSVRRGGDGKAQRGDRTTGHNKFMVGSSARELPKTRGGAAAGKENLGSLAMNKQQKPQPRKAEPVRYEPYNSPFRAYLSQIENDFGVTSVESIGRQASRGDEIHKSTQMPGDASLADAYGFSVRNINPEAYEDDVSTLGDESIRRSRMTLPLREGSLAGDLSFLAPPEPKSGKKGSYLQKSLPPACVDDMHIDQSRTSSTLIGNLTGDSDDNLISPKSDLDSSMMTYDDVNGCDNRDGNPTVDLDDNATNACDDKTSKVHDGNTAHLGDGDQSAPFLERNKWIIIYFMVGLALFLLLVAGAALTFSFLYLNQSQQDVSSTSTSEANNLVAAPTNPPLTTAPQPQPTVPPQPPTTRPPQPKIPSPTPTEDNVEDDANVSPTVGPSNFQAPEQTQEEQTDVPTISATEDILGQHNDTTVDNNSTDPNSDVLAQLEIEQDLLSIIASFSPASIATVGDTATPQYQAFDWLVNDPRYLEYNIASVLQRWVLAVFFFSTGGPEWKTENFPETFADGVTPLGKTPWISYTDECMWETTNLGDGAKVCDDDNMVFAIHLKKLGLTGSIPIELGLLSSGLEILYISENELTGSLPAELGDLSLMTKLQANKNLLQGTIPSQLGQLTGLTKLSLGDNRLEGPIPSELGLLSSVDDLGLEKNVLQGTLPPELCNMILVSKCRAIVLCLSLVLWTYLSMRHLLSILFVTSCALVLDPQKRSP